MRLRLQQRHGSHLQQQNSNKIVKFKPKKILTSFHKDEIDVGGVNGGHGGGQVAVGCGSERDEVGLGEMGNEG